MVSRYDILRPLTSFILSLWIFRIHATKYPGIGHVATIPANPTNALYSLRSAP